MRGLAMRGLIVAAPSSGSGKTTVTLGLVAALRAAGYRVAAAKAGPDYIDPGFLGAAAGRPAFNLDIWAMGAAGITANLGHIAASGAEFCLVEGVMGLFDGIGAAGVGSTADLAAALDWPVLLVIDGRGIAGSAAAILRGFQGFRADVTIAGVIVNRVGSASHAAVIREACALACPDIAFLGAVPRTGGLGVRERHLGLVQASETAGLDRLIEDAGKTVGAAIALDQVIALARPLPTSASASGAPAIAPPPAQRIAVAEDPAFGFAYPHLLAGWRAAGAEISTFSPLADQPPPPADFLFLPGGYPELSAGRLAANRRCLDAIAAFPGPVFGECGGYMLMGEALIDADGTAHRMSGLLPLTTSFADRRLHLGYRQATLIADGPLGPAGRAWRGHEFHYATIAATGAAAPLFQARDGQGRDLGPIGQRRGLACGSFLHLIAPAPAGPHPVTPGPRQPSTPGQPLTMTVPS